MLNRVIIVCLLGLFFLSGCQVQQTMDLDKEWHYYKARFVMQDGRVVDTGNDNISHSEGQGYGLLLAVRSNDRNAFDKIWYWSRKNLQVRKDSLFIWRRRPGVSLQDEDMNNASDGDIIIAWALLEASQKWQSKKYQQEALRILTDIRHKLITSWNDMDIVLPGAVGFKHSKIMDINLSYWIFPAFAVFERYDNDPVWKKLQYSGIELLRQARFGRWQLPADWVGLQEDKTIRAIKSKHFGYDAVRIPLYLIWGEHTDKTILAPFLEYWIFYGRYTPAWIALNEYVMDAYGGGVGIRAIKQLTLLMNGKQSADFDKLSEQDYYQSTLLLLSKLCYRQLTN